MSHFVATVTLYDVLDRVQIAVRLYDSDGPEDEPRSALTCTFSAPGQGTDDPKKWVRDALMWAVESL